MAKDGKKPEYEMPRLQLHVVESAGPDSYRREIPSYSKRDRNGGKKKPPVKRKPWMWFPPSNAASSYRLDNMVDEMLYSPHNTEAQ
jgi:hypothetical protein